jgi:molybdate transport system ATP-binding protein
MRGDRRLLVRARVAGERPERPRLDVDLEFPAGITAVMGGSGAGKSSLLTTIAGLLRPTDGQIVLDGEVLFDSDARIVVAPHKRRVGLVFQSLALFPHLNVWQNVAYGLPVRDLRRERAMYWLARTHVEHLAERRLATLSGGEAQRVALARVLASEPRAMLLDEPFSALDEALRIRIGAELRALIEELSIPTLLVTHDQRDALRLGLRTVTLEGGREHSPPFARPAKLRAPRRLFFLPTRKLAATRH